jgi:hypothetical protein
VGSGESARRGGGGIRETAMEADHERDDDEPRGGGTQWRVGSVDVAGWRAAMGAVEGGTLNV